MEIPLLVLLFHVAIVLAIRFVLRHMPPSDKAEDAKSQLRSYLAQGRNYRVYVGTPFDSPTEWQQVEVVGQTLSLAGERLELNEITAFLVVYPNGEVLSAEQEFYPLPEGVTILETKPHPLQDILNPEELNGGQAFVKINFGPSVPRHKEPGHYSTTLQNISDKKIRVLKFAGFTRSGTGFQLSTVTGDYFSADEFINWYGVAKDGWILPGQTVADPNNYGGSDGYWVYYFETEESKEFAAGARIPR